MTVDKVITVVIPNDLSCLSALKDTLDEAVDLECIKGGYTDSVPTGFDFWGDTPLNLSVDKSGHLRVSLTVTLTKEQINVAS